MKKVYYINHLSDRDNSRNNSLAGDNKIDYIIEVLKKCNYELEVISFCDVRDKKHILKRHKGYEKSYNDVKIKYFTCYSSKFKIIRGVGRILTWLSQKKYIKKMCINNDCKVIIYHSLAFLKLYRYLYYKKKEFILEVEEIYSDVLQDLKKRKKEIQYFQFAKKYILITELVNKEINILHKPYVLSHGTYKVENEQKKINLDKSKIHCVYAGTFSEHKGGVYSSIAAAEYLPSNYHIHVLGYTSDLLLKKVKANIATIQKKTQAIITYDGLLLGDEYTRFMQSCDIGLSTQNPNASFNATSFPSKILSYMANGLRVVSIRIPAVETSKVGKYIYYYDNQSPKDIAKAIMKVDMSDKYNSRAIIKKLDKEFKEDLVSLIEK